MAQARIKSLKIFGFKSFAYETEIQFPERFTVIVGPNGSGKSNIVDALRWVLGDHSYRMLRISEPADLICQSTKTKINFASVKLVLSIGEELHEFERKINRGGEISYFHNGQEIKLKDLLNFLAQWKIGTRGFSVINQGMSDMFLRASPKERYEMLSEVFGTKFLEFRKKETLNNLEMAEKKYQSLERELSKIKPLIEIYQREKEKLSKKEDLEKKLEELNQKLKKAEKYELEVKRGKIVEEINDLEKKIDELNLELEKISPFKIEFPEERLNELQKKKIELLERVNKLKSGPTFTKKIDLLKELKEGLLSILNMKTLEEIYRKVKELLLLFEERKERETTDEEKILIEEINKINQEILQEEEKIKEKKKAYEEKLSQIKEREEKLIRYKYQKEKLEEMLREIEKSLLELKDFTPEKGNADILRREINEIKEEIWRLGAIDEDILKEGEKYLEKYAKIAKDIEDVEKSMESLKEKIAHYEREIKTTFKMYLDRINLDLDKYFQEFFGPGELKLVLHEEEIHIKFKHQIKNIKTLEGLSGGERSLLSIILIFSLIQTSEPPFLILDEIDSALDENNAQKFVRLIKNLSYRTQFIVITHNRVTMENADTIYGVSMDQDGISKVFSLKLKKEP